MADQAQLDEVLAELQRRLAPEARAHREGDHLGRVPTVGCADGLTMSVQASAFHYCLPRDSRGPWQDVEVGFPSREVPEIAEHAEDPGDPTNTVYGYVPLAKVAEAIVNAGGFAKSES